MAAKRAATGDAFNNPYHNTTLVGNWLEDRQQKRVYLTGRAGAAMTWYADGVFGDPAVSTAADPAAVQADLRHSVYDVDYCRRHRRPSGPGGVAGAESTLGRGSAVGSAQAMGSTLMLGSKHSEAAAAASGAVTSKAKGGVDKVLLFTKDPVTDPAAPLPLSTNADTYGAFYHGDSGAGAYPTVASSSRPQSATGADADLDTTSHTAAAGSDDRTLYESVTRMAAGAPQTATSAFAAAGSALPALKRRPTLSRTTATTDAIRPTGWTLSSIGAPAILATEKSDGPAKTRQPCLRHRHKFASEAAGGLGGERWCTSKQAADIPVDHFTLQRRLPPVRV